MLAALIRKRETGKSASANSANPAKDGRGKHGSLAKLATLALATTSEPKPTNRVDPAAEARRQRLLTMLADNPALRLAVVCDGDCDPVPVAVAIRDKGTCEVLIPAARFDQFALLDMVERHTMIH